MSGSGIEVTTTAGGSGAIAHICLSRPPGNRVGLDMLRALVAQVGILSQRSDLRAVYLTGAGDDFSHGVHLRDPGMAERMMSGEAGQREVALLGQRLIDLWAGLKVPTIVGAQGWVIGAGACLFTASDFRYASPGSRIRFPEVGNGMHLSWGILPRMVQVYGPAQAKWLALAGETIAMPKLGAEAGVVRIVDDPVASARQLAERFAAEAPLAVQAVKATLTEVADLSQAPAQHDPERFAQTIGTEDFGEAVAAFFARRPPAFKGR